MTKVAPTVQSAQARSIDRPEDREESAGDSDANPIVAIPGGAPAKVAKATPSERANDPVRLYLREISSVDLLSREGEVSRSINRNRRMVNRASRAASMVMP